MAKETWYEMAALWLLIIGGINWLLVGVFDFNLVSWLVHDWVWLERVVYVLVGASAGVVAWAEAND